MYGGDADLSTTFTFESLENYQAILDEYYYSDWSRASYILMIFFILWFVGHLTFLILQLEC